MMRGPLVENRTPVLRVTVGCTNHCATNGPYIITFWSTERESNPTSYSYIQVGGSIRDIPTLLIRLLYRLSYRCKNGAKMVQVEGVTPSSSFIQRAYSRLLLQLVCRLVYIHHGVSSASVLRMFSLNYTSIVFIDIRIDIFRQVLCRSHN
jgi:hypothetical protein